MRVRAFNHLGPGQTNRFVAPALAERIALNELEGGEVVPVGNLTPRRDFTDVRDVVRAYRLLIEHGEPGEAYNVCSGHDIAISELADRLVAMAARPMRLEGDPTLQRPVDVPVLRGRLHPPPQGHRLGTRDRPRPDPQPTCSTSGGPGSSV